MPDYRDNQCDDSLLHAIRTICVFVYTYWSYVKRATFYRTFISQSFVRGNNSNDPVAGRVSGVVVDEGVFTIRYMKCGRKWRVVAHEGRRKWGVLLYNVIP